MGFIGSFISWLMLIFVVVVILYVVFSYFLGWIYNNQSENLGIQEENNSTKKHKRLVAIFIIAIILILMISTGFSVFTNTEPT